MESREEGRKEGRKEAREVRARFARCVMFSCYLPMMIAPASAERGISPPPSAPNIRHVGEAKGETKKGRNVGYGYGGGV